MVKRLKQTVVSRDIQALVRAFPSRRLVVYRPTRTYGSMSQQTLTAVTVYDGEALFIPATGTITEQPIGQVANKMPQLLINGNWPIQQGDMVRIDGRVYLVAFAPNHWQAFTVLQLDDRGPGTP